MSNARAAAAWRRLGNASGPAPDSHSGGEGAGDDDAQDAPGHGLHFGWHEHEHEHEDGTVHNHGHTHGHNADGGSVWDDEHDDNDGHEHDATDGDGPAPPTINPWERAAERKNAAKGGTMARQYVRNPGRQAPQVRESALDRLVGERFSLPPGAVTDRDRRAYEPMMAATAMRGMPRPAGRPWSATAALFDRQAPGAAGAKDHRHLGQLVQALHRQATGTGPQVVNSAMSERVPAEGGFLIGEALRTDLMLLALEQAIIRPRAMVVPMTEYREHIPVAEEGAHSATVGALGGFAMTWVEEGAAPSASTPGLGNITLTAHKLEGWTTAPNELFTDSRKLDSFLRTAIPAAISWYEDAAFIGGETSGYGSGTGAGQPQGILNAPCAITVTRGTGGTVALADVYSMITRMLPKSMNNYIWLGSPDVVNKLLSIFFNFGSATSGIVPPSGWLTWSPDGQLQLLGRPFFATEHVNALGTQGDLVAVDPSFYCIGDRLELTIDVALEGGTGFIRDEAEIRVKERIDGRIYLASAVTPTNASATCSPVVILK